VVNNYNYKTINDTCEFIKKRWNNTKIGISNLVINDDLDMEDSIVKYSEILPYLRKIFDGTQSKDTLLIGSDECGFPLCIISKINENWKNLTQLRTNSPEDSIKIEKCNQCNYEKYCAGFKKNYIEIYGIDEINTIID
jgi:hypothetical protein